MSRSLPARSAELPSCRYSETKGAARRSSSARCDRAGSGGFFFVASEREIRGKPSGDSLSRESSEYFDAHGAGFGPLIECDMLQDDLAEYEQITTSNLRVFSGKVKEAGPHLLVLSEAHSYGAPAGSFYEDLRVPRRCGGNLLSHEDSAAFSDKLGQSYLRAASKAGTLMYDLAGEMEPLISGADGGRYMHDGVRYTADGSREVARLVAPVIRRIRAEY